MIKGRLLSLSIVFLAISIIFGSTYIGNSISQYNNKPDTAIEPSVTTALISREEAANYLGIPVADFDLILKKEKNERNTLAVFDSDRFIRSIKIGGTEYFSTIELDKWIVYNMR